MTLKDLENIIDDNASVGITDKNYSDFPLVDTWSEMKSKILKTLDVPVKSITSCAYILIVLDI